MAAQNDFCAGGALAVPEGDSTVDVANALIDWSLARGEPIVASQDWHPADHGSFASQHQVEPYTVGDLDGLAQTFWPDHCVQHSEGAALHPLLKQQAIAAVFHKGQNRIIDSYSAFFDNGHRQKTELDGWLRGQGIVELTVLGLATTAGGTFYALGKQGEQIKKIDRQTNGTLSALREENDRLTRESIELAKQVPTETGAVPVGEMLRRDLS